MIKLFHVISDSNIGGAGRYLLTYLRNCDRNEFEISIAVPTGSLLKDPIEKLGFKAYEINGIAEKSFSSDGIKQLKELFKKYKPDIVHAHASLSARIAAKVSGVKVIVYTRHSVFPQKRSLTSGLGRFVNGTVGKVLSTGIIAVAKAAGKNLTDTGISDKLIRVIYNGVDKAPVVDKSEIDAFKLKYNIYDEPIVAIIARLNKVKGHEYFIKAARILYDRGINAKFVIAGTGEEEEKLKKLVSDLELSDTVVFTGFLEQVHLLENAMTIQVNASFGTEAASLSLLEGMSLGKPAVVSDFGGNPEIIENGVNGFVVPQCNENALADKIYELLNNKELYNEISNGATKIYCEKYTSEIMTKQTEDYYKKLMRC